LDLTYKVDELHLQRTAGRRLDCAEIVGGLLGIPVVAQV